MAEIIGKIIVMIGAFLLFALFVKLLWNGIVTDFGLPELTYWKAVGLSLLCNLLFRETVKFK